MNLDYSFSLAIVILCNLPLILLSIELLRGEGGLP